MAFNPTSDVVLDVLNAADPARASMAAERLAALASGAPARDFTLDLDKATAAAAASAASLTPGLANARQALAGATDPSARAKVEFEAMALNSFIGEMLPRESSAYFGQGTAGEVWRSMLSEQISRQIAKSGALGLSRRLFATHELAAGERRAGGTAATEVESSVNILSAPASADLVSGAVISGARKRT
jgi:Rod binding domain-containing protein